MSGCHGTDGGIDVDDFRGDGANARRAVGDGCSARSDGVDGADGHCACRENRARCGRRRCVSGSVDHAVGDRRRAVEDVRRGSEARCLDCAALAGGI